jgi:hypothetical protein
VVLQSLAFAGAGAALQFDGLTGYVQVTHNQSLNPFPLTATAWFRTTNGTAGIQGLVSKYVDGSGNGWFLIVQGGHLVGYYSAALGDQAIYATSAASVADGFWHHAALTVDANGGKLYLDGIQVGSGTWGGSAGPPTGTQPLQIGKYYNLPDYFSGTIDEVTLWNRALGIAEVNYLQHRPLNGNEDGLVALWHFNENSGTSAGDATGHGYIGLLVNTPAWVASSAPLVFNQVAGNALKFDGANGYVVATNASDLNSYPFTATAWFRTTNTANVVQGIVSKYADASANGWTLMVQNAHLRGFYYRNSSFSDVAIDATSVATVADDSWHHAALTVDGSGGKLFLDGAIVGQSPWAGAPGGTTSIEPLQIGRYYNFAQQFQGAIDEVTVWNRALATTEIQSFMNLPRIGNETGLVACWHLNEGSGTNTTDATSFGHTGVLVGNPAWAGSTAFLGDGTSAIHTTLGAVQWSRQFAVKTISAQSGFAASAPVWVRRLDDFGAPGGVTNVNVTLPVSLQGTLFGAVPLPASATGFSAALPPYLAAAPQATAGGVLQSPTLNVQPQNVQLDSVNDTFRLSVTENYSVNNGPTITQETITLPPTPLLHFDGKLIFGPVTTAFSSIANNPVRGALAGGGVGTALAVNNNSGYIISSPSHTYGNGTPINCVLLGNGDAVASNTVPMNAPANDTGTIQNISFLRTSESLTPTGAIAYADVLMPLGFSIGISPTNHETIGFAPLGYVLLDANLNPVNSAFVVNGPLFGIEETLPYLFGAPNLTWQVNSGQVILNLNATSVFVRQEEDNLLQGATGLADPTTTNRVSNDGYFRNAAPAGSQMIVTADSNGVAWVSVQLALQPPELRPHFPYSGRAPGAQFPTGSGLLVISNSSVAAGSYLNVGAVLVSYNRDCNFPGCTAAQAGPAILNFTPNGGQLAFTPDGGLLAYGSVPPTNLMWGYATAGNFAQRAGLVGTGAFCMAGTFLHADQTTLTDAQRPAVILFSGFGDGSNPAYLERPGQSSYNDGFANYPGLNFRSPALGESYVGQTNSGSYALDSVSKYYVRAGGVNGIHQAAQSAFPSSLKLYGYNFTFTDFGLSYLDGQNWDSVATGAVSFPPQPAGVAQEFDKMKLTCRGDLDSAKVPAGGSAKHLAYWNVDFTPQSIDFHPTNDDTCGISPRFLVLGVETKLPFIPQALHASLGFKPNGDLVCPLDNVLNVDSRFQVPAQLSLQGPGGTFFTLSTAAEGYFNNWETAGAQSLGTGFYNLAGKIRVPFFTDVKVHLHVTPANASAAQVNIMGGWPDPDSAAADLGWSVNNSNYFNRVEFDPHSDGWPVTQVSQIGDYRNSSSTKYHPRAQRDWLEVAKFDYPLVFDNVLHRFKGFQDAPVQLPIVDVNSRLKELAPGKVDFDFAQDLTVQLPRVKVLDFVNDALNGNIGPLVSVSNAIRSSLNQTLDVTGINNLSKMLREDAQDFFNPILAPVIDPVVSGIFPALASIPQTNVPAFLQQVYNTIATGGALQTGIGALNNVSNQASSIVLTVDKTLTDVLNTAGLLDRVIAKDPATGQRKAVTTIIEKIVSDQAPDLQFTTTLVGPAADSILNPLLADIDPTLQEIQSDLEDASNQVAQVQAQLESVSGNFNGALAAVLQDANGLQQFLQQAGQNVTNYLASVVTPAGDLFTANPAAVQQAIRQQIVSAFLSSALTANYQKTFRDFLGDDKFVLDQLMNALFDQINSTIRNALADQIQGATDNQFLNMKGAGLLGGTLLSAKIKGAPTFDGDSLRNIHLNAAIQMNLPDKMNFNAYMDIKELNSQSVPVGCIPSGSPAAEITLGAKNVPLNWAGVTSGQSAQSLTLSIEARWTQQSGAVIGIGGSLDIGGSASFEGCSLKDLGAALAIGQTENYFAAKVDATVPILGIPVNMKAGFFAGHACSLDPLKYVDPDVNKVLLNNPSDFTGVYVQYGGGLSLSDLLGVSAGCLLDADATVSTAYYWQGGASLGVIGGRQAMGVKISLLCVLSGELDFAEFLAVDTSGAITVGGSADACGSIGPCPFCVSGCKSVTIKGVVSTHGVDYFVDY